jgi:predicted Zn-dependent protease with MMP-like domain
MSDEEFESLVAEALDSLPPEFAKRMENVSVTFADYPTPYQLRKMNLPPWALMFGLYEGVPLTKRGGNYAGFLPDKITIFKNAILRVADTPEKIKAQVRSTVIHEIGHHFGLTDEQMR